MSPEEHLKMLERNNIKISRKTWYNWEKAKLISEPYFRNSRTADYSPEVFEQAYAAYIFTQKGLTIPVLDFNVKISLEAVATIRKAVLEMEEMASKSIVDYNFDTIAFWVGHEGFLEVLNTVFPPRDEHALQNIWHREYWWWLEQYHDLLERGRAIRRREGL